MWGAGTTDTLTTTFGYSGTQLISITTPYRPATRAWTLGYDPSGRLASLTSPISGTAGQTGYTPADTTTLSYNAGTTTVVEGAGSSAPLTTTYTLDTQAQATQITDGLNQSSYVAYDQDHDVTSFKDANGNQSAYAYQYVGPTGSTGLITQTDSPPVATYTTTNSLAPQTTFYHYNARNDLTEVDLPGGGAALFGYDAHHSVVTTTSLLTNIPSTGNFTLNWQAALTRYDAYGERTATIDGRGFVAPLTSQSSDGSIVAPTPQLDPVQAPLATRSYTYTAQGDLLSASTPPLTTTLNGALQASQPVTTSYGYDGDGDLTAMTSTNRAVTTQNVDHLGRVTRLTQPDVPLYDVTSASPVQTIGYDGDGNVVTTTDALGAASVRSYDPLGRLVALRNPLGRTALITYTAMALTATQDVSGTVTHYAADALGRPTTVTDPLNTQTSYGYDAMGNTTAITTPLDFAHVATTTVE